MTENQEKVVNYEINQKRYTVIARCKEDKGDLDKLYDIICQYVISQIN